MITWEIFYERSSNYYSSLSLPPLSFSSPSSPPRVQKGKEGEGGGKGEGGSGDLREKRWRKEEERGGKRRGGGNIPINLLQNSSKSPTVSHAHCSNCAFALRNMIFLASKYVATPVPVHKPPPPILSGMTESQSQSESESERTIDRERWRQKRDSLTHSSASAYDESGGQAGEDGVVP